MNTIKAALIKAMEAYFKEDVRRINHAHRVTEYAEELLKREGGDYPIVIGAAVLHDLSGTSSQSSVAIMVNFNCLSSVVKNRWLPHLQSLAPKPGIASN